MKKIKNILRNKTLWIVLIIIVAGGVLRFWNFESGMHYQLDQARDYRIIHAAIEYGPGELPLQGPRAAGSFLRLGPLFYYLEYVSALIFGDTPAGSVVVVLILNIFAICLFYLFLRKFFGQKISIGLSSIFSASVFIITYSRFGWNPTLLIFFMLLLAYALLEASDSENKKKGWWVVLSSGALVFAMNMHFLAFVAAPAISVIYLFWTKPKIAKKYWVMAISLFIFLNIPLIVNDAKTGGDNTKEFVKTVLNRSDVKEGASKHTIVEKFVLNSNLHAQYNWIILTGDQLVDLPKIKGNDIRCDQGCRDGLVRGIISAFLLILSAIIGAIFYYLEKDKTKKNFLKLVFVWEAVIFVAYTILAYDVAPRFFLINAPLALVGFGFILKIIIKKGSSNGKRIAVLLIALCVLANLFFVGKYFNELYQAEKNEGFELNYSDKILKERTRVTFSQMEDITNWMEEKHKKNNYPIFIHSQAEYKRAFWERIDYRNIKREHIPESLNPLYRQGNYFVIIRTQSDQKAYLKKYLESMDIVEISKFGTLTAYYLKPKNDFITNEKKIFEEKSRDPKFSPGVQVRYLWRQVFK